MKGYCRVILGNLIQKAENNPEVFSMQELQKILSGFFCPFNNDVELFLKEKAIPFERQGIYDTDIRKEIITAPLIGQIGKNFACNYNELITGAELLKNRL